MIDVVESFKMRNRSRCGKAVPVKPVLRKKLIAVGGMQTLGQTNSHVIILIQPQRGIVKTNSFPGRIINEFRPEEVAFWKIPAEGLSEDVALRGLYLVCPNTYASSLVIYVVHIGKGDLSLWPTPKKLSLPFQLGGKKPVIAIHIGHVVAGDRLQGIDPALGNTLVARMIDRRDEIWISRVEASNKLLGSVRGVIIHNGYLAGL